MLQTALVIVVVTGAATVQAPPHATCRSLGTEPARTWRFERTAAGWTIAHAVGDNTSTPVRLALPAATDVRWTAASVYVKGRTSNGGIDVSLTGTPSRATLDLYVSYELEVNVDASLTPAIDELNTNGPVGVRCDVTGEAR